ncbi:Tetratricopeptide repeat protein 28 [Bulinus truncatus]|nr:Tetratricopeptide repeat protein 28 [Bulinus truncatus]
MYGKGVVVVSVVYVWEGCGGGEVQNVSIPAPTPSPTSQAIYLQKLLESSEAVKTGNFRRAVQLYTEAIELDPENHILFTNRSAAHLKNGQLEKSLADARKARTICPKWGKGTSLTGDITLQGTSLFRGHHSQGTSLTTPDRKHKLPTLISDSEVLAC